MKSKILIGMLLFGSLIKTSNTHLEEDLFDAIFDRDNIAVQRLLDEGAMVDSRDSEGMTPLMHAAKNGEHEIVETLIKANADTNLKTFNTNKRALDFASKKLLFAANSNDYQNIIKLLTLYSNIQYRKMNLKARSLTPPEYIAEKTKNMDEKELNTMSDQQHDALLQAAQENEVDYIYRKFFPAYEQFIKKNGSLPLITFFNDIISPKPGLLGIMASKIFISSQALYDCLAELAKNSTDINSINMLHELLKQTEIIMRMRNESKIPDKPVRLTDEPE